jgi:hypothetical protein
MRRVLGRLLAAVCAVAIMSAVIPARADGAPPDPEVEIAEALQDGQDVTVRLGIPDGALHYEFDLVRREWYEQQYGEPYVLLDDHLFHEDDAVDTYVSPLGFECLAFEVIDECVPPGEYHYELSSIVHSTHGWAEVEDTGDECLATPDDEVGDTGLGCSISAGPGATANALGLLMLGIGLAGLLVSCRRN